MTQFQLTCLGTFHATLNDVPLIAFQTDKVRALLAYLAVERKPHLRSELVHFLWEGYSEESANNSLRQTIHRLRHILRDAEAEPSWLLINRQSVQLNPVAPVSVDATTFSQFIADCAKHQHEQLATCQPCLARLRQAVELYRGDFLANFSVAASNAFEEWRRIKQEEFHLQTLDALAYLANAAEQAGDDEQALQNVYRQLTLEPWLEAAHRCVMRVLARREQRAAAIAQYQRCRQVLAEEFGGAPGAETTALYEQIRSGEFDKVTRRGGDKAIPVSLSPPRPLSLSPSLPLSPSPLLDWAEMPAVDFFTGRAAEVAQLTAWLEPSASSGIASVQLVSILGMGGMGKTTLAAAVTQALAPTFAVVIWRSLLNAPPLGELLLTWLQILSRQTIMALPESLDEQLRLLLTYLQQERCLLVLDNVESIFAADTPVPGGTPHPASRAGATRPGYTDYDQLLQRLASSAHQSCLVLTSREQPYALLRLGRQAQESTGRVRVLPLTGLNHQASHTLLQSNGLHTSAAEAAHLRHSYSGNPLALQIVAATIADFFGGDVAAFRQEEGTLFDGIRHVLDQQFARLSPLERDLLIWLAIEREETPVQSLRKNLVQPVATAELLEALQALQNRSLLEKRDTGLTLQNVITEYVTEYLVAQVTQEILDFRFAILLVS